MKTLHVTNEISSRFSEHLKDGRYLQTGQASLKTAWIRKARAMLLMLDPKVEETGRGILGRAYIDLTRDLETIENQKEPIDQDYAIERKFTSAISTIESVVDCIHFAPEAIISSSADPNPYFFDLPDMEYKNLVFVLMPFSESWSDRIWKQQLKPIVESINIQPSLTCKRADDLYGHDVLLDIVAAIKNASIVIADITTRNPNVFYELGIAHCLGQKVLLLTQTVDDIPFDLQRFRHIIYQDNSDGYSELKRRLKPAILELLS